MDEGVAVLTTLVLLSAVLSVGIAVSARSIGRLPHAQCWSRAFALAAAAWALNIAHGLTGFGGAWSIAIVSLAAMAVPLLLWKGLSQRSDRSPPGRCWVLAALLLTVIIFIAALHHADGLWAALSQFFRVLVLCSALGHVAISNGQARSDEQMMKLLLALLAIISLVVGAFALARQFAFDPWLGDFDRWLLLLALPAVFTGIGITALALIANDLAAGLRRLANTDPLTGVLNRRGFDQMSEPIISMVGRDGIDAALILVDIDRFKSINDRYGHEAGDQVLAAFARAMEKELGQGVLFGRTGGEEFSVLLRGATIDHAMAMIERCRVRLRSVAVDVAPDLRLTASFGLTAIELADDLTAAQRRADGALYAAKEGGRDRASVAEPLAVTGQQAA